MKNYRFVSRYWALVFARKIIFALLVAVGGAILSATEIAGVSAGKINQDNLEYGVTYSCPQMNNYEFKIISCDAKNWCQVFISNKFSSGGGNVTGQSKDSVLSLIKKNECGIKGHPPVAKEKTVQTENKNDKDKNGGEKTQTAPPEENATFASCPSPPEITAKSKTADSMELKSKRAILARFRQAVDKGEKLGVEISFESFQLGPPRNNRRGGTLYLEDAPVGAKIYPIKSKFTLCSLFTTEITLDLIDGRYECFKDNFGEWSCATASGYRIINTKYQKIKK